MMMAVLEDDHDRKNESCNNVGCDDNCDGDYDDCKTIVNVK